ncbi:hypothetical protein F8568_042120 [Actinomadura sp. LD22]|uniref:Lipoprotein n=1 Tax=Actinomadura physcomitrii TaxID=2650748 RepID=A0A6I4MMG8_9ACTN|nr:hypothetical protein [Actinomadura physcomitrii]MWA06833.1 hypothetical protein [Actinomadura physcomitrii]
MAHRLLPLAVLATVAAASACGGSGGSGGGTVPGPARAAPAGTGYTSDQLGQALLQQVTGYWRGEPDSGEYGSLKALRNAAQVRQEATLDKPKCADAQTGGRRQVAADVPTALVTFVKGDGQTATETLMGVADADAEKQVEARVPPGCLTFRTRLGDKWAEHRITETPRGDIGNGSRTVGVATTIGAQRMNTWYVVFQGRHYLGSVSVFGPNATRAEAESLARASVAQAHRILGR